MATFPLIGKLPVVWTMVWTTQDESERMSERGNFPLES